MNTVLSKPQVSKPPAVVTVADVAKEAGVALGTVSRALNNVPGVKPQVRDRVLEAARALNYTRLRRKKISSRPASNGVHGAGTRSIGVVCFGMEDSLVQLPVVSSALQEIESTIGAMGGSLLLSIIPKGDRVPEFLSSHSVAGLILKGPNQGELPSPATNRMLRELYQFPYIWLMGRLPGAPGDHCNFDTDEAGRIAATHLYERGHRCVAFFNPKPGQTQFEKVKRGYVDHAMRLGCKVELYEAPPPAARMWPLPAITASGKVSTLVAQWLAVPAKQRPTAIFVPSDRTAIQVYTAMSANGIMVGRDVGLISCNNEQSIISGLTPKLTTIDVCAPCIGSRAVHQLFWRVDHPNDPVTAQILVMPRLVEGASVPMLKVK